MVEKFKEDVLLLEEDVTNSNKEHNIILYNDDVNSFDHVIECLIKICEHEPMQAEQCAYITHYNGKCDVKSGSYYELKPKKESLIEEGLNVTIQ